MREAKPIIVPNVLAEKRYRYPELARKNGLASLLSAPMISRDKVIGTDQYLYRGAAHRSLKMKSIS